MRRRLSRPPEGEEGEDKAANKKQVCPYIARTELQK
jgi:hypothetical protein